MKWRKQAAHIRTPTSRYLIPSPCFVSWATQHNTTHENETVGDTKSHLGGVEAPGLTRSSQVTWVECVITYIHHVRQKPEEEKKKAAFWRGKLHLQTKGWKPRGVPKGWGSNIHPDFIYLPSWHKGRVRHSTYWAPDFHAWLHNDAWECYNLFPEGCNIEACACCLVCCSCPLTSIDYGHITKSVCIHSKSTMNYVEKPDWKSHLLYCSYGCGKCMFVGFLKFGYTHVFLVVFTIRCRIFMNIWRCRPISFKHVTIFMMLALLILIEPHTNQIEGYDKESEPLEIYLP